MIVSGHMKRVVRLQSSLALGFQTSVEASRYALGPPARVKVSKSQLDTPLCRHSHVGAMKLLENPIRTFQAGFRPPEEKATCGKPSPSRPPCQE